MVWTVPASSIADACHPRSPAAPGACSVTGAANVRPPSFERAVRIARAGVACVPRHRDLRQRTGHRSQRHAWRNLAAHARVTGDRVDPYRRVEAAAAVAAGGDIDIAFARQPKPPRPPRRTVRRRQPTAWRWSGPRRLALHRPARHWSITSRRGSQKLQQKAMLRCQTPLQFA